MPLFGSQSSPLEGDIEKATAESLVSEDWPLIFEICDKLNSAGEKGCKDAVKVILKRLLHKNPRVVYYSLILLETCGKNCGREFLLQVSTREFCQEVQSLLSTKGQQPKIKNKLLNLIETWHKQFTNDPQFGMIHELYSKLKEDHSVVFPDSATLAADAAMSTSSLISTTANPEDLYAGSKSSSSGSSKTSSRSTVKKEQEDLAKAIALSLKETNATPASLQNLFTPPSAPYSGLSFGTANLDSVGRLESPKEIKKVRALYDFEAVESNELTFKAGELIILQDDSDENWWKGENHRGTGLFPAHFVTKDLDAAVPGANESAEEDLTKKHGSVAFQDEVKVIEYNNVGDASNNPVEIDADKISRVLQFLETADPTGAVPDPPDMLALEAECYAMGPLIDEQLHQLDLEHVKFTELNKKVIDALNMYHKLMEHSPAPVAFKPAPTSMYGSMMAPPISGGFVPPHSMGGTAFYGSGQMGQGTMGMSNEAAADSGGKQAGVATSVAGLPQGDFNQQGYPLSMNGNAPHMTPGQYSMQTGVGTPMGATAQPPAAAGYGAMSSGQGMYAPQPHYSNTSEPSTNTHGSYIAGSSPQYHPSSGYAQ